MQKERSTWKRCQRCALSQGVQSASSFVSWDCGVCRCCGLIGLAGRGTRDGRLEYEKGPDYWARNCFIQLITAKPENMVVAEAETAVGRQH